MGRAPCCDKANVKKGPWSPEEDAKLKDYIQKHGTGGNWIALPQKVGLKRCGKSCRLRWLNYLRPNIKHGEFSDEEDRIIINLFANIGSRWSIIAAQLPGRTDNDIKNYWNTKLKKKLMGIINNQSPTQTQLRKSPINTISSSSSSNISSSPYLVQSPYMITSPFNTQSGSLISSNNSSIITDHHHHHHHFEPNISTFSSMNNLQVPQDQSFLSQMQHFNHQASCSSSDGSQYGSRDNQSSSEFDHPQPVNGVTNRAYNNNFHGSTVEEKLVDLVSSTGSVVFDYGNSSQSSSATDHHHHHHQVVSDNSVVDYGLEEIKQLISSTNVSSSTNNISCSNNFLFDENKTDQERVLYYYYY